jgi:hypothetical protein
VENAAKLWKALSAQFRPPPTTLTDAIVSLDSSQDRPDKLKKGRAVENFDYSPSDLPLCRGRSISELLSKMG